MKRVALVVLSLSLVPASARSSRTCETVTETSAAPAPVKQLREAAPVAMLASGYALPIVEMPPPPVVIRDALHETEELRTDDRESKTENREAENREPRADGCPVDVRAIVVSDVRADSFVILGWDDTTALLHRGQRARGPQGSIRVARIDDGSVVLEAGGVAVTCRLSTSTR